MTTTPTMTDSTFICFSSSHFATVPFFLRYFFSQSSKITTAVEFSPPERLDIAAARIPAKTKPAIPTGKPTAIKRGKNLSDCSSTLFPSPSRYGFLKKNASRARPTNPSRILTKRLESKEMPKLLRADFKSFVAR